MKSTNRSQQDDVLYAVKKMERWSTDMDRLHDIYMT